MNLTRFSLQHRPIVLAALAVALSGGLLTFTSLPRAEDPVIKIRDGVVLTTWPGAPATKVEELVTDPIEKKVMEIAEVKELKSVSRVGQSIVTVTLREEVTEVDQVWDEVRNKVSEVNAELPPGCREPWVNSDFGETSSVCLALYQVPLAGSEEVEPAQLYTNRELEVLADRVRDELRTIEAVSKVAYYGRQDEVIYLEVDGREWSKIALSSGDLGQALDAQNIVAPGGTIDTEHERFTLNPSGELQSVAEIGDVVVGRVDESLPVKLGDVRARVERTYRDPPATIARFATPERSPQRCLFLNISMRDGFNVVQMGADIEALIARMRASGSLPPDVELTLTNDLPRQVGTLVSDFVNNLFQSILIVLAVAFLMMGWRPALIMAAAVPLCMISTFVFLPGAEVWLEQFSIASLIIALGMLVDNAIVVTDNIARLTRTGLSKVEAAVQTHRELAVPILTSTLTTVGAFGPMVTIIGSTGEYVRSLPIVVSLALLVSYLIAMMVTPLLCTWVLRPDGADSSPLAWAVERLRSPQGEGAASGGLYELLIRWCMRHKFLTLSAAAAAVAGSLMLVPAIGTQFFPQGTRDQFFIDVWLPEGTPIRATEAQVAAIEELVLETRVRELDGRQVDCLNNVVSYVGGGPPRLILTMAPEQRFPNYAFMVVNTTDPFSSAPWVAELRERVRDIPGARISVKRHMLGPPTDKPVEFRLIGDDPTLLREKAEEMTAILRDTPGTLNPFHDWYSSGYQVDVQIDSQAANLAGVTNKDVAASLNALISGGYLTTFREGDHQVDVMLRMRAEQRAHLGDLSGLYVNGRAGKVPLSSLAQVVPTWEPAVIARRDNRRCVSAGSEVEAGLLSNDVAAAALPKMRAMMAELPPTYRLEQGGELEKSVEGQEKIASAFQISAALILLVLVAQYNSFLKPFVILAAVPLALVGALVGLYTTGWAIGFMPLLGIVSLAGVVINNAIILVDFIESRVGEGAPLRDAVAEAGRLRMGPIVLTTLTTVGGMLPLALFAGPMWAGMAWAVIFGLAFSTALTLLVVPTIYVTCAEVFGMRVAGAPAPAPAASPSLTGTERLPAPELPAAEPEPPPAAKEAAPEGSEDDAPEA